MLVSCGASVGPSSGSSESAQLKTLAVTQIVEHPSLDAVRDGLKEELKTLGYTEGENLAWDWQSAQGNPATAAQIAQKFVGDQPSAIVAIATPSAQAAAAATQDIPIIFSAVTDPVDAKLVASAEAPGGNVTGVSDLTPVGEHLDLIKKITPQVKTLGVIYNVGEANSVTLVKLIEAAVGDRGLSLQKATATNSAGVATAAKSLVGKVDAIYVPTDNTVASALEAVLQVGYDNQLPVYAGDNDSVKRGAIASLSFDYAGIGRETAKLVDRVFKGESPAAMAVVYPDTLELAINSGSAQKMGVDVPATILSEAKTVFE
ncbi:MAG: ABC transporter substrate-binding protein [Synechococcales cyanobacterium RU_4_20]|nr:ABC transporter substrate-binding protein [Synechococcales cyanobacterium RU_4_20]NJR70247.1 ABC transporter substrate-binding protein [Synechococcales cyanobacterium CRU_2_2]